jgi:hypothetical protein
MTQRSLLGLSFVFLLAAMATCHGSSGTSSGGGGSGGEDWCPGDGFDGSKCGNGVCDADWNEEGCCGDCEDTTNCPQNCKPTCEECMCELVAAEHGCQDDCYDPGDGGVGASACEGGDGTDACWACVSSWCSEC